MIDNFCKLALEHGGFVQELTIPADVSEKTGLTNPTLIVENDKYILNLRHVQYSLYHSEGEQKYQTAWGPLCYFNPEDDITLRTKNYMCELDPETLSIKSYNLTNTSKLDVKPLWEFIGLEDARLVKWDNKLYQSGVRRDTTTNGVGRMELSEIVDNAEVSRTRIEPPSDTYCEKNWMPVLDLPYHYVKWTSPTEVVKVNTKTKKASTVKLVDQPFQFPRDIRGGSQVIRYKDYYVALTHEVDLWKNYLDQKDAQYYHRFIVWDKDWNIVHYSQEFKFMTARIEFSCGLAIDNNQMIIPFGFQDTTAFIVKFPIELFEYLVGMTDNVEVKTVNKTYHLLESFIKNPFDDHSTFNLAKRYYSDKHYSSALSFYLRVAEYSNVSNTVYSSLVQVAKCLDKIERRPHATSIAYLNAISVLPNRPEAYYAMCVYYEHKKEFHQCYVNACIGLQFSKGMKENLELEYPGEYALLFQKALSAWHIGKKNESIEIFKSIKLNYDIPDNYLQIINNNLSYITGQIHSKLDNFPAVHAVSLDECQDRRFNLEEKFNQYGVNRIKFHTFSRYTGEYDITGKHSESVLIPHIGAITSHIFTIKDWYDYTNEEYAFFCEDDLSFETIQYWKFTWDEFIENLPSDWEVVQLCLISETNKDITFSERGIWDWGCQAYIMKRSYAAKVINTHYKDGAFDLTIPGYPDILPCIETVLFLGLGKVYNFPLFVEDLNFESTYAVQRSIHFDSYNKVIDYWKNNNFNPLSMLN